MKQDITILIVEDSFDDYFLLKEVLESSEEIEVKIIHEDRLEGAISVANNKVVDVAVIDLSLPDSFGLDTYVSFHQKHPLIPTVIMTGTKDYEMAFTAVQNGAQDYLFKGEPSPTAIIRTIRYAIERQRLMTELKTALEHVQQLQGMLPICSSCKKIRDDKGYWNRIESYISSHSKVIFSHSICPDCVKKLYPNLVSSHD
ncbi:MAG: response regulator [Desulfobacteraceae bacterium]|jgi:DNA-binding NtrC family response regulator|nr:response regulator [Desulfobacteraceae bacterium]